MKPASPFSVAIIGAGIAGLAAGHKLREVGLDPILFDRGRAAGGRCSTRRAAPFTFDHGAQYFTARDRIFQKAVEKWERMGLCAEWKGRIVALQRGGATAASEGTKRYVGVPSMASIPQALAEGLTIHSSSEVSGLSRSAAGWTLHGPARETLGVFDRLILAMPPAQAAYLLPFGHPLDQIIEPLEMKPVWALMLGLAAPFGVEFDGAFCAESSLSWIARNNSKPGRPESEAWVLHANPDWTEQHLDDDHDWLAQTMQAEVCALTGIRLPEVEYNKLHRWGLATPSNRSESRVWIDRGTGLALAGDAYMGGRMEGAYVSGRLAAEAIVGDSALAPGQE